MGRERRRMLTEKMRKVASGPNLMGPSARLKTSQRAHGFASEPKIASFSKQGKERVPKMASPADSNSA